jgi:hypothetical protein
MAVTRPLKEGSVTTYQAKVAAGFPDILASEMDADLDTIYAAWNGGVATANLVDGSVTTPKLAAAPNGVGTTNVNDGAITSTKLAAGAAAANLVLARTQASATFGQSSTAVFTLFQGTSAVLPAGRILRWEIGGQYSVTAGQLQFLIYAAGTQLAAFPIIGVGSGNWRIQGLIAPKVSPTTDVFVAQALELWTTASTASTPSSTPAAVEGGACHSVTNGNQTPIVLAGGFNTSNASNTCSIFLGLSYLL